MQRLIISTEFPKAFVHKYLKRCFINLVKNEISRNKKSDIINYILDTYSISLSDLLNYLNHVRIDTYKNIYILHIDVLDKNSQGVAISEILHLLNYGNVEQRGIHSIDRSINYMKSNIRHLYRIYSFNCSRKENLE